MVKRVVACCGGAPVLVVVDRHTYVALGDGIQHLTGAIAGAVIDDEQLEVLEDLMLEGLDRPPHIAVDVVGRHDDGDHGDLWRHTRQSPDSVLL